jgi:geranylgeranyl pyrophosphate synthase
MEQRLLINSILVSKIKTAFTDPFIASSVEKCVLPGRKIRSILFLNALQSLGPSTPIDKAEDVVFSIELIHAASVLVDDILDSDDVRHGTVSTEALWGTQKSLLFAHLLSSAAIKQLKGHTQVQAKLIETYQNMCIGEMYDVFLPPGTWMHDGYDWRTFQKTSSLFEFALIAAQHFVQNSGKKFKLDLIGRDLGLLYQLSNDYYDWQPHNLKKRHLNAESWPINFSLPLSVYLRKYPRSSIESYLAKKILTYNEWDEFLSILWQPEVTRECKVMISRTQKRLKQRITEGDFPKYLNALFRSFVSLIGKEEFWYHAYEIY